jgi:hypothetical protein
MQIVLDNILEWVYPSFGSYPYITLVGDVVINSMSPNF